MPFIDSLYLQMTWSYLWALATPLVLWASARLPIERNNWIRSSLLHVPISILLSVFLRLSAIFLWLAGATGQASHFRSQMSRFVVLNFSEALAFHMLIALT